MANYDQAEGLRRMLELPKLRVINFLSTLPVAEKNGVLINFAATLAKQGKNTLMVDAKTTVAGVSSWLNLNSEQSLLAVAKHQRTIESVIKEISPRLSITKVTGTGHVMSTLNQIECRELSKVFDVAASKSEMVVVDCDLNFDDSFLLSSFDESEMIIQVSKDANSIKNAYGLIKRINGRLGHRHFGVMVSGANHGQAQLVFENLSTTAKRYLAVELSFTGFVPEDEYLKRATALGRSVIDAFPLSKASSAFMRMTDRLLLPVASDWQFDSGPRMGAHLEY